MKIETKTVFTEIGVTVTDVPEVASNVGISNIILEGFEYGAVQAGSTISYNDLPEILRPVSAAQAKEKLRNRSMNNLADVRDLKALEERVANQDALIRAMRELLVSNNLIEDVDLISMELAFKQTSK